MAPVDDRVIGRWRMASQHLVGTPAASAEHVVGDLLCVQAENHSQASWAVAARAAGVTESSFAAAFDAGEILRTHVIRPTWHFVRPDDIRWLLELTAPRIRRNLTQIKHDTGVDDRMMARSAELIVDILTADGPLTRDALGEQLRAAGLPAEGRGLGLMVLGAELDALVCSGPKQDGVHTLSLLDDRAPTARRLTRAEALAEIVLRYFTGHGPATERDLAYWATLTLTDVRSGLAAAGDQLGRFEHEGREFWFGQDDPRSEGPTPRGHLLQVLDEYHHGYQDSRWTLDADGHANRGRTKSMGMAVVDGQLVAEMRRTVGDDSVQFDVEAYRPLGDDEVAAITDAGDRCGRFLAREATVTFSR